jgi:chromosome segregation ATPase
MVKSQNVFKSHSDLKKENERLKRELKVREMAIKDLQEKLKDSVPKFNHDRAIEKLKTKLEEAENTMVFWYGKAGEHENSFNKEHSLVINLDAELENKREELRQAREEVVSQGKELEHLRPLMVLYMKEKVEG